MIPARLQPYLFAAVAGLGLAAVMGYDLYRERDRSIEEAKATTANLAHLLEAHTRQGLRRVEGLLAQAQGPIDAALALAPAAPVAPLAAIAPPTLAPPAPADRPALRLALKSLLPADGLVSGVLWLGDDGRIFASVFKDPEPGAAGPAPPGELPLREWLSKSLAAPPGRLTFGPIWRAPSGTRQMVVGQRIATLYGRGAGSVLAIVELATFQPALDAIDTGANGFVTLFLTDGWMLATAPQKDSLFTRHWFDSPMFKEHLPRAPTGTVRQVVVRDGTERVYSYRALADYPVIVSTGISMTDALADLRVRAAWDVVLFALVCAAMLAAAAALSRTYARQQAAELASAASADEARRAQQESAAARDEAQQSERFLRDITDNLPLRISYIDRALRYRFVNQAHCDRFGLAREAILGRTREELTGETLPAALRGHLESVLDGRDQRFEIEEPAAGGVRVIETHFVPDVDAGGATRGFYAASADVSERHAQRRRIEQALAERETLLREVYHRVKNNLQVVQSLLNLQRRSLPEGPARAALDESAQRVHAMALVHEKLYQSGGLDAIVLHEYLADLLRHVGDTANAARRGIALRAQIEPLEVSLEHSVPLGLLVTELVGNSLKHAFPEGRSGSITVSLHRAPGGMQLEVRDDGIGLPEPFDLERNSSMGLQLAASLAGQLGGRLQAHSHGGACFTVELARLGSPPPTGPAGSS